jgi:hypothetical protein
MSDHPSPAKCPSCGSTDLVAGCLGRETYWFRDGGPILSPGWQLRAFVCRVCGVLTPYLSAADLVTLRKKTIGPPAASEQPGG